MLRYYGTQNSIAVQLALQGCSFTLEASLKQNRSQLELSTEFTLVGLLWEGDQAKPVQLGHSLVLYIILLLLKFTFIKHGTL
jgi:hypothetical protein